MTEFKTRIYYKIIITLVSSLSVGSGDNKITDHDVITDSQGNPFIPATTIAGVLRSGINKDTDLDSKIFGYIKTDSNETKKEYPSQVAIYDARLVKNEKNSFFITSRDSVKLKNKVAVDGAKFDMQAVEPGSEFVSYIELFDRNYADEIERLLTLLNAGILRFGTKTTRGYGQVKVDVFKKEIATVDEWLDFDLFADDSIIDKITLPRISEYNQIKLKLKLKGGISIREYSTDVDMPDYETMGLSFQRTNGEKNPVIPGTSWAGAFRERFNEFSDEETANSLFGYVNTVKGSDKAEENSKSKIVFNESILKNGTYKEYTRNSIDRFSGATKDSALYTEKTYYYGETELIITFLKDLNKKEKFAVAACLADLQNGFLAVGGLTSIGRGLFEIQSVSVNGNEKEKAAELLKADTLNLPAFIEEVWKI